MGEERKLKRLNLRTPKSFAYNWSETENPRIRFFLVTEGPTEESYFDGIKNNKRELGIKNDIHIEIIPKAEGDENMIQTCYLVIRKIYAINGLKMLPKRKSIWKSL